MRCSAAQTTVACRPRGPPRRSSLARANLGNGVRIGGMYVPSAFAETRPDVLHAFMRRHAFATLITAGRHGPVASHVPTVLLPARGASGAVQAHLARPN